MNTLKRLISALCLLVILLSPLNVYAQTATPTPSVTTTLTPTPTQDSEEYKSLQSKIADLEKKVQDTQAQGKTLTSQITVMDGQMKLTQLRISATESQLKVLGKDIQTAESKIVNLEKSLHDITKTLINRIKVSYAIGVHQPLQSLLTAKDANDLVSRANYLKIVQEHDRQLIYDTQQAKNDYENQKQIFSTKVKTAESLQDQLHGYTEKLEDDKKSKQQLLSVTKNDEEKYQRMLREARAQISSFKSFATSNLGGGASILPPQASPDGWYYNQRDSRWGNNNIGSSPEKVWEVGCLLSSIAMVLKQRGESVTPADIAGNSSYFFSDTAYMLIPWAGGKFTSVWNANLDGIDSKLSSGPVIVGLRAGPYGMHFIVLKSGSKGDYVMNDPWNGPDLKFSDHYSTGQIFQYGYLN